MRLLPLARSLLFRGFNPRICKRCDFVNKNGIRFQVVSIHASVKDATYLTKSNRAVSLCFNPRICKRCDTIFLDGLPKQPGFNPRICKRCDRFQVDEALTVGVSIHASVKDATHKM